MKTMEHTVTSSMASASAFLIFLNIIGEPTINVSELSYVCSCAYGL